LNKREEKENAKTMPLKVEKKEKTQGTEKPVAWNDIQGTGKPEASKKTAPKGKTEKQKNCPHPYADVVRLTGGITICNHCYDCIEFPIVA
jgi:hypothetical protein